MNLEDIIILSLMFGIIPIIWCIFIIKAIVCEIRENKLNKIKQFKVSYNFSSLGIGQNGCYSLDGCKSILLNSVFTCSENNLIDFIHKKHNIQVGEGVSVNVIKKEIFTI